MKSIVLDDALHVSFPDDFQEMSREELAAFKNGVGDHGICLKSDKQHIIFSLAWVKDGLLSKIARGNDLVKNAENFYKKRMRSYGYKTQGYVTYDIGGEKADGLRYTYTAQGIDMTGETYAIRKDHKLYYIHCYYRTELSKESRESIEKILGTAAWDN